MSKMGNRIRVIRENYRMAKQYDPKLGWILAAILVFGIAAFVVLGMVTGNLITWIIVGVSAVFVVLSIVFSRRAMRSAYKSIEGQPGAAVAVVQNMKKAGWGITAGVAVDKHENIVHRSVGRAGVVLLGEGSGPAVPALLANEHRRTKRFVSDIPISELVVGNAEGQVPISKLEKHLRKMPKVLAPGEVTSIRKRLDALATAPLPLPKGPMPKTGRMPRGGKLR